MTATTTRTYTAADLVQDQTAHLDWQALRAYAAQEYGLDQDATWHLTRPALIAAMTLLEQQCAIDLQYAYLDEWIASDTRATIA